MREEEFCLALIVLYCFLVYFFFSNLMKRRLSQQLIKAGYFKWNRLSSKDWLRLQNILYTVDDATSWSNIAIKALCNRDEAAVARILYGTTHSSR